MAHPPEVRERVRTAYVYQRLTMEVVALKCGVPFTTAQTWKARALKKGDNWDKARAAVGLSAGNMDEMGMALFNDFLIMFKATQDVLSTASDDTLTSLQVANLKVQGIASLADSLAKMTACLKRLLPELNRAEAAQGIINALAEFIAAQYPQHLAAFVDILEPFARHLANSEMVKK